MAGARLDLVHEIGDVILGVLFFPQMQGGPQIGLKPEPQKKESAGLPVAVGDQKLGCFQDGDTTASIRRRCVAVEKFG
jgi:hypothetical protein